MLKGLDPQHLRCTALPLTLLLAVDAHKFANTRWSSPRAGAKKHSKWSAFCLLTYTRNLLVLSVIIPAHTCSKTEREEQRRRGRERRKERKSVLLRRSRQSRRTRICTQSLLHGKLGLFPYAISKYCDLGILQNGKIKTASPPSFFIAKT